jgi:hypothetical protein
LWNLTGGNENVITKVLADSKSNPTGPAGSIEILMAVISADSMSDNCNFALKTLILISKSNDKQSNEYRHRMGSSKVGLLELLVRSTLKQQKQSDIRRTSLNLLTIIASDKMNLLRMGSKELGLIEILKDISKEENNTEDCEMTLKILWDLSLLKENKEIMKNESNGIVKTLINLSNTSQQSSVVVHDYAVSILWTISGGDEHFIRKVLNKLHDDRDKSKKQLTTIEILMSIISADKKSETCNIALNTLILISPSQEYAIKMGTAEIGLLELLKSIMKKSKPEIRNDSLRLLAIISSEIKNLSRMGAKELGLIELLRDIGKEELNSDGSKCVECELALKILWNMSLLRDNKEIMRADAMGLVDALISLSITQIAPTNDSSGLGNVLRTMKDDVFNNIRDFAISILWNLTGGNENVITKVLADSKSNPTGPAGSIEILMAVISADSMSDNCNFALKTLILISKYQEYRHRMGSSKVGLLELLVRSTLKQQKQPDIRRTSLNLLTIIASDKMNLLRMGSKELGLIEILKDISKEENNTEDCETTLNILLKMTFCNDIKVFLMQETMGLLSVLRQILEPVRSVSDITSRKYLALCLQLFENLIFSRETVNQVQDSTLREVVLKKKNTERSPEKISADKTPEDIANNKGSLETAPSVEVNSKNEEQLEHITNCGLMRSHLILLRLGDPKNHMFYVERLLAFSKDAAFRRFLGIECSDSMDTLMNIIRDQKDKNEDMRSKAVDFLSNLSSNQEVNCYMMTESFNFVELLVDLCNESSRSNQLKSIEILTALSSNSRNKSELSQDRNGLVQLLIDKVDADIPTISESCMVVLYNILIDDSCKEENRNNKFDSVVIDNLGCSMHVLILSLKLLMKKSTGELRLSALFLFANISLYREIVLGFQHMDLLDLLKSIILEDLKSISCVYSMEILDNLSKITANVSKMGTEEVGLIAIMQSIIIPQKSLLATGRILISTRRSGRLNTPGGRTSIDEIGDLQFLALFVVDNLACSLDNIVMMGSESLGLVEFLMLILRDESKVDMFVNVLHILRKIAAGSDINRQRMGTDYLLVIEVLMALASRNDFIPEHKDIRLLAVDLLLVLSENNSNKIRMGSASSKLGFIELILSFCKQTVDTESSSSSSSFSSSSSSAVYFSKICFRIIESLAINTVNKIRMGSESLGLIEFIMSVIIQSDNIFLEKVSICFNILLTLSMNNGNKSRMGSSKLGLVDLLLPILVIEVRCDVQTNTLLILKNLSENNENKVSMGKIAFINLLLPLIRREEDDPEEGRIICLSILHNISKSTDSNIKVLLGTEECALVKTLVDIIPHLRDTKDTDALEMSLSVLLSLTKVKQNKIRFGIGDLGLMYHLETLLHDIDVESHLSTIILTIIQNTSVVESNKAAIGTEGMIYNLTVVLQNLNKLSSKPSLDARITVLYVFQNLSAVNSINSMLGRQEKYVSFIDNLICNLKTDNVEVKLRALHVTFNVSLDRANANVIGKCKEGIYESLIRLLVDKKQDNRLKAVQILFNIASSSVENQIQMGLDEENGIVENLVQFIDKNSSSSPALCRKALLILNMLTFAPENKVRMCLDKVGLVGSLKRILETDSPFETENTIIALNTIQNLAVHIDNKVILTSENSQLLEALLFLFRRQFVTFDPLDEAVIEIPENKYERMKNDAVALALALATEKASVAVLSTEKVSGEEDEEDGEESEYEDEEEGEEDEEEKKLAAEAAPLSDEEVARLYEENESKRRAIEEAEHVKIENERLAAEETERARLELERLIAEETERIRLEVERKTVEAATARDEKRRNVRSIISSILLNFSQCGKNDIIKARLGLPFMRQLKSGNDSSSSSSFTFDPPAILKLASNPDQPVACIPQERIAIPVEVASPALQVPQVPQANTVVVVVEEAKAAAVVATTSLQSQPELLGAIELWMLLLSDSAVYMDKSYPDLLFKFLSFVYNICNNDINRERFGSESARIIEFVITSAREVKSAEVVLKCLNILHHLSKCKSNEAQFMSTKVGYVPFLSNVIKEEVRKKMIVKKDDFAENVLIKVLDCIWSLAKNPDFHAELANSSTSGGLLDLLTSLLRDYKKSSIEVSHRVLECVKNLSLHKDNKVKMASNETSLVDFVVIVCRDGMQNDDVGAMKNA